MVGDADENGEEAFTSEGTELEALRKELDDTRRSLAAENAKCREVLEMAKRIQADFDNYKKRAVREREDIVRAANDKLVLELLSTLDDLERATETDWDEARAARRHRAGKEQPPIIAERLRPEGDTQRAIRPAATRGLRCGARERTRSSSRSIRKVIASAHGY